MVIEADIKTLAGMVRGRIAGVYNPAERLSGTCSVDNFLRGKITFIRKESYSGYLNELHDAVIILPESLEAYAGRYPENAYIIVDDAAEAMITLQDYFYGESHQPVKEGIAHSAVIDESAEIGDGVCIGENVVIGRNAVIGSGTVIHPNAVIHDNCRIGRYCTIYSGAVIGSSGFRITQNPERKTIRRMIHAGNVVIGDRAEIGANTTIDRATFENDSTEIGDDARIDNLVQIGHNARIGARNVIAAHSCIGGSVRTGTDAWTGIGVTVSSGVKIGNRAKLLLNAVVAYDVPDDEAVSGFYAMPHRTWKKLWENWRKQS